jgi:hypothetical protein
MREICNDPLPQTTLLMLEPESAEILARNTVLVSFP